MMLMVGGNKKFAARDRIKTLNIERKVLKEKCDFTCFIFPGIGSATEFAQDFYS